VVPGAWQPATASDAAAATTAIAFNRMVVSPFVTPMNPLPGERADERDGRLSALSRFWSWKSLWS
jgi:hypothetical protein